jgi:putative transposase
MLNLLQISVEKHCIYMYSDNMSEVNVGYKFRFYPNAAQIQQLKHENGCTRFVFNHALYMCVKAYERRKTKYSFSSLSKHFTKLKTLPKYSWLKDVAATTIIQTLIDLDTAYTNFFEKRAERPRFKNKRHHQAIRYQLDQRTLHTTYLAGKKLKLPKLGELNIKWSQIPRGIPKMVTVIQNSDGKYYISFSCVEQLTPKANSNREVGIDLGIKDNIVTSNGEHSGAPRNTYKYERELRSLQRALARKIKGSKRYEKMRVKVARLHSKIKNCRLDGQHKLTTQVINDYDVIYIEDLNVAGMLKNRRLAKAIADVGMCELKRQLMYKAHWYGKEVHMISRWEPTSKQCSSCHKMHDMVLSKRSISCECGLVLDRDENAAINILAAGRVVRVERQKQPVNRDSKSLLTCVAMKRESQSL